VPSPVGGPWACPRKKINFALKNYAIPSKFWYLFPILQHKNFQHAKIITSASEKVGGDYPPVLKLGDLSPCPPPCSDAYVRLVPQTILHDRSYGASVCVCTLATAVQLHVKWSCKDKSQLQTAQRLMFRLNSE